MSKYSNLPSISLLRSFEAAARYESYTMAAEELGVTQGAVSRQVHELEAGLGVALFNRVGRAVRLTNAGRSLLNDLTGDMDHLHGTINKAITAGAGAAFITVAVLPTFAARWLVPRLPDFNKLHPGIELNLQSRSVPFDLEGERVDLAIHYGRADWPDAKLIPMCPEDLIVVASPDLFNKFDLCNKSNVLNGPLLHLASRPKLWTRYHHQLGETGSAVFSGPCFDNFYMIISGAIAGLGAAILPAYLIEKELETGELIQIEKLVSGGDEGYFVAMPLGLRNRFAEYLSTWLIKQAKTSRRQSQSKTGPDCA